jgi:hypothetical protein
MNNIKLTFKTMTHETNTETKSVKSQSIYDVTHRMFAECVQNPIDTTYYNWVVTISSKRKSEYKFLF